MDLVGVQIFLISYVPCIPASPCSLFGILCSQYSTEGKVKEPNLAAEAGQGLLSAVSSYARGDMRGAMSSGMNLFKTATGSSQKANNHAKATRTSPADVVRFGC
jgi:hypothetical protein